jgi:hypothetical protein
MVPACSYGQILFSTFSATLIGMCYNGGGYLLSELSGATTMAGIKYYFLSQIICESPTKPICHRKGVVINRITVPGGRHHDGHCHKYMSPSDG